MELNVRYIRMIEKAGAIAYLFIPEFILRFGKRLLRGNDSRSKILSNTKAYLVKRTRKAMNNLDMVKKTCDFVLEDKVVLEFGTGGHGIDLVVSYLMGAKKIYTVDIAFFGLMNMPQAIHDMESLIETMDDQFGLSQIKQRYDRIKGRTDIQGLLETINVTFVTYRELEKNANAISEPVDFFFSESALQRVPLKQMVPLLDHVPFAEGAVMMHKINCSDINILTSRPFRDPNLWRFDYLKFSDFMWDLITTKRFGSQNRMRQQHYTDLFGRYGFTTAFVENFYNEKADIERCRKAKFYHKFRIMDPVNVAIANFRITSKRGFDPKRTVARNYLKRGGVPDINTVWTDHTGLRYENETQIEVS